MRTIIIIVVLMTMTACSLNPAPITTMDVKAETAGLSGEPLTKKNEEIIKKIDERKAEIHSQKIRYNVVLVCGFVASVFFIGIPTYLLQEDTRRAMEKEVKNLDHKKAQLQSSPVVQASGI